MTDDHKSRPQELLRQLDSLRSQMLDLAASGQTEFAAIHPAHRPSATNLLHYLALRPRHSRITGSARLSRAFVFGAHRAARLQRLASGG